MNRSSFSTTLFVIQVMILGVLYSIFHYSYSSSIENKPYNSLYTDPLYFKKLISDKDNFMPPQDDITGITIPHHLLASDLISRSFHLASGKKYKRIIFLFPDHFKKSKKPFSTTTRDFNTPIGKVITDKTITNQLIKNNSDISYSDLFEQDHGIQTHTPFIAYHFPRAKIIPIAVRIDSNREDWDMLVQKINLLINNDTLIVQSTDFSHYLSYPEALKQDQKTLNIISTGNFDHIAKLNQPDQIDSKGSQYIHMKLQQEVFGLSPKVIDNKNSFQYIPSMFSNSVSYIAQIYKKKTLSNIRLIDSKKFYFAGDTFLGRYLEKHIRDPDKLRKIKEEVLAITHGYPLIINLEGSLITNIENTHFPQRRLGMPASISLQLFKDINVVAVSLANNHSLDFGVAQQEKMIQVLKDNNILAIKHGEIVDLGRFRLLGLTDIMNEGSHRREFISKQDLKKIINEDTKPPLISFIHWGKEFSPIAEERENNISKELRHIGVTAIIGTHPHTASKGFDLLADGKVIRKFSLGNFIFDQLDKKSTTSILEVSIFKQNTFYLTEYKIQNIYKSMYH